MKRDMDLVRRILSDLSESQNPLQASVFINDEHDRKSIGYHFKIMREAGLIEASILGADRDPYWRCEAVDLTWEGQEFLANIKNESIWSKTKSTIAKRTGDASFSVMAKLASDLVSQNLLG